MPFQGFTLDFHTPWINGMAKKMILLGLRALINPATRNLVINHHGKVFELKAIAEALGDVYFLFLIVSPTEYAIWKIEDEGATLIPNGFNIGNRSTFYTVSSPDHIFPSVCKSNKDNNLHYVMIQTNPLLPGIDSSQAENRYGLNCQYYFLGGSWKFVVVGLRAGYEPSEWSPTGPEVLNTLAYKSDANYICSSRHPYIVDSNGDVLKNLEFWETGSGVGRIEYDTEEGHQIGDSFNYSAQDDIYAVISKDKLAYVDPVDNPLDDNFTDGPDQVSYTVGCCGDTHFFQLMTQFENLTYSGAAKYFKFGDVVIDMVGGTLSHQIIVGTIVGHSSCIPPVDKVPRDHSILIQRTAPTLEVMDYDNVEGDKTFILFYEIYAATRTHFEWIDVKRPGAGMEYYRKEVGPGRGYRMVYRINNGEVVNELICTLVNGTVTTRVPFSECTVTGPDVSVTAFQGQRIRNVTCQATEKYLLYSYTLQTYNGPVGEQHFKDKDDVLWDFNKCILGIIDIETGTRTEHEVDDSLLGDLYKDTFDEEKASAVGLHIT